jgi:hypothetical protein
MEAGLSLPREDRGRFFSILGSRADDLAAAVLKENHPAQIAELMSSWRKQ